MDSALPEKHRASTILSRTNGKTVTQGTKKRNPMHRKLELDDTAKSIKTVPTPNIDFNGTLPTNVSKNCNKAMTFLALCFDMIHHGNFCEKTATGFDQIRGPAGVRRIGGTAA